ncbi:hypothetical protein DZJ_04180 [Dickeya ananatis]
MMSDNDDLATAVATGLIESLVTATDGNESVWKEIESNLHAESKKARSIVEKFWAIIGCS